MKKLKVSYKENELPGKIGLSLYLESETPEENKLLTEIWEKINATGPAQPGRYSKGLAFFFPKIFH